MLRQARRSAVEREACSGGPRTPWEVARLGQVRGIRQDEAFRRAFGEVPLGASRPTRRCGRSHGVTGGEQVKPAGVDLPEPDDAERPWRPGDGTLPPLPDGALGTFPISIEDWSRGGAGRPADIWIPDTALWASDCRSGGVVGTCGNPNESYATIGCTDSDFKRTVNVESNCDLYGFTDLIEEAWCLLNDNLDLLEWAWCASGLEDFSAMEDRLTRRAFRVNVTCETSIEIETDGVTAERCNVAAPIFGSGTAASGGVIRICLYNDTNWHYKFMWDCGDEAVRTCVLLDFACFLAHELTHVEGLRHDDYVEGCDKIYLFENTLRYLLLRRYRAAWDAECCSLYLIGNAVGSPPDPQDLFLSEAIWAIDPTCTCPSTSTRGGRRSGDRGEIDPSRERLE